MSSINLHTKEINAKIVYYGPGLGGKTTTLQYFHRALRPELRGQLVSLATGVDRTLYFDFLPVKLPALKDFTIRLSLYTVPGQVHYNATRKLVLQGCDGVVLVADSQTVRREANIESVQNLEDNLRVQGMNPETVPTILQYNKRDLPEICSIEQLNAELNSSGLPHFGTCALTGQNLFEGLRLIAKLVLNDLKRKGIYREKTTRSAPVFDSAPLVSPSVEESLVRALENRQAILPPKTIESDPPGAGRSLTFSLFWPAGPQRDQMLAMEGEIEREDYAAVFKRAEGIVHEMVQKTDVHKDLAEAMLMLGIFGGHYARFQRILSEKKATKKNALFCLFFLSDMILRLQRDPTS
jgi:signal recognition particle receptor subunit beta